MALCQKPYDLIEENSSNQVSRLSVGPMLLQLVNDLVNSVCELLHKVTVDFRRERISLLADLLREEICLDELN